MNSKQLAESILNIITPFLVELLEPGSLTWFEGAQKSVDQRNMAEDYWKILLPIINSNTHFLQLIKKYAKNTKDDWVRNDVLVNLTQIIENNANIFQPADSSPQTITNSINISGNVSKSNIVVGNGNTVSNYSVSVGNVHTVVINQGGVNRSAQIKDVSIDFSLPNGRYPVFYWLDRSGLYSVLGDKTWWDPEWYSYDKLMDTLMEEINKWTNNGWEIIENDLDNLWIIDHGYSERYLTFLTRLAVPVGTVLKHWRRYKGAQFHVRRFL